MKQQPSSSALFATVLALITLIGPLSLHLFFPATPAVKRDLGVNDSLAQLTVSIPMFTMAVLTLVYGSASDRYGRRPVLLGGILLFVAGGALSAAAGSIWTLIAGRLIQAAGGACGLSLARTIARDVFGTERLVKVIAYLTMAYSMGPMVAPPIGGLLVDGFGWRSVLAFACGTGLAIAVLVYLVMHETLPDHVRTRPRRSLLADYRMLFRDLRFTALVLQSGLCSGAFFTMATSASLLMTDYLHRPASEYGFYFMMFPIGYWTGTVISTRLSGRVPIETVVLASSVLLVLTVAGQAAIVIAGVLTPLAIFIPGLLVTLSQGIALPNAQAGAISIAGDLAGTAAGIGVFVQMFVAGLFSQLYGVLADGTPTPMVIVVSLSAVLSFGFSVVPFILARRSQPIGLR